MSLIEIELAHRQGSFELAMNLALPADGITVVLGPSGCGKSTLLRLLAGLEKPLMGHIKLGDRCWVDSKRRHALTPQQRRVGMVFQDYALFPHMNVAQNIGYAVPRWKRNKQVIQWLERMQLEAYAKRYPHQLSGGQRQRVALARALIREPELLLLDEPFSAADVQIRHQLRAQLLDLVSRFERPVVMVTHDLEEARYLADRLLVMVNGRLHRCGSSAEVFDNPGDIDTARVVGWRNLLPVQSLTSIHVRGTWGAIALDHELPIESAWVGIRPEHLRLAREQEVGLMAQVESITELGAIKEVQCRLIDGTRLWMHRCWDEVQPAPGSRVKLVLPVQHLRPLSNEPLLAKPLSNSSCGMDLLPTNTSGARHIA